MDSAAQMKHELSRELARVRLALLGRQFARAAARALAFASCGVLLAVLFARLLPWLVTGHTSTMAEVALALAGAAGAALGLWRSFHGWNYPTDADCALAIESEHADASLPTAVELGTEGGFAAPVLERARQTVLQHPALRLGAAVSTVTVVGAPLLALLAVVAVIAGAQLPANNAAPQLSAPTEQSRNAALRSTPSAADVTAYEQAMGERQKQSALAKAASDLRDESKTDAQRQQSLDDARNAASKGASAAEADKTVPEKAPAGKAEREALAAKLEAAAATAGTRADALERGKGAAITDTGGSVNVDANKPRAMQPAPHYEPRRFENTREALSDQSAARREMAQAAAEALAKIKQGR